MEQAIRNDDIGSVRLLLDSGADLNTSLYTACTIGNHKIVKLLLEEYRADPYGNMLFGPLINTATWAVVQKDGNSKVVKELLEHGVDSNFDSLVIATNAGNYEVVKLLLNHKPNYTIDYDHCFHIATIRGYHEIAELFQKMIKWLSRKKFVAINNLVSHQELLTDELTDEDLGELLKTKDLQELQKNLDYTAKEIQKICLKKKCLQMKNYKN